MYSWYPAAGADGVFRSLIRSGLDAVEQGGQELGTGNGIDIDERDLQLCVAVGMADADFDVRLASPVQ